MGIERGIVDCGVLSLAACQHPMRMKEEASVDYHAGRVTAANAKIELAVQREHSSEGYVSQSHWDLSRSEMPPYALELAMLELRNGDPEAARGALLPIRNELVERCIDTTLEFLGIQALRMRTREQFLTSAEHYVYLDLAVPFASLAYEELSALTLLELTEALQGRQNLTPFAHQFSAAQGAILGSSFGVDSETFDPRDAHRAIAGGNYVEVVVLEATGSPNAAVRPYTEASTLEPEVGIVREALDRVTDGRARSVAGTGVVHVFYLLGRGPQFEDSRYLLQESDPEVELLTRMLTLILELAGDFLDGDEVEIDADLVRALLMAPVPIPVLIDDPEPIPVVRVSAPDHAVEVEAETLIDYREHAPQQQEALKSVRVMRAVVGRYLKNALGAQGGGVGSALALGSQFVEPVDTRSWRTLPAELRVARQTLPHGVQYVDLGYGSELLRVGIGDSFIVVIAPSRDTPATTLVDQLSRLDPVRP